MGLHDDDAVDLIGGHITGIHRKSAEPQMFPLLLGHYLQKLIRSNDMIV